MAVKYVDFGAFADKHIHIVDGGQTSSDVMSLAVTRLTGRASLRFGIKKVTKSGIVKYSGQFHSDVVTDNQAIYRSGTTTNSIIILTSAALSAWEAEILAEAKKQGSGEFHHETDIKSAAALTMGMSDNKSYGSDLDMSGGYGVKVNVLVKIDGETATVVHLEDVSTYTHSIPGTSLQDQSAIFTEKFLTGLGAM